MERYDDVAFTVTEEPEPLSPRARLRRRVAAVMTAAIVGFGGLAAAADALTSSPAPASSKQIRYYGDGAVRDGKVGHPCHRHGGSMPGEMHRFDPDRGDNASGLQY
jgi:hypothetical protein